jgi:hypothetical protein
VWAVEYFQQRHPLVLIAADDSDSDEDSSAISVDGDAEVGLTGGPECSHCKTWSTDPPATQLALPFLPPFSLPSPATSPRARPDPPRCSVHAYTYASSVKLW